MKRVSAAAIRWLLYGIGLVASLMMMWHILVVALGVTLGKTSPALTLPFLTQLQLFFVSVVSLPSVLLASHRLRAGGMNVWSGLVLQMGLCLFVIAISYRLAALVVFVAVPVSHVTLRYRRRPVSWWLCGLVVVLSLAPVDIALRQTSTSSRPRFVPVEYCDHVARLVRDGDAGLLVCVPDSPVLYSEPRLVLVW